MIFEIPQHVSYFCEADNSFFHSPGSMRDHVLRAHAHARGRSVKDVILCKRCFKVFENESQLRVHVLQAADQHIFPLPVTQATFTNEDSEQADVNVLDVTNQTSTKH